MKKTGLGRGLESLMGVSAEIERETVSEGSRSEVDINLIDVNKEQARKAFSEEGIRELADSIKLHGIIQPLILTKHNGRYTIVAGERRYRAARLAGLKTVPAVVRTFEEEKLLELSLIENIQREDLNPVDEAKAILRLMQQHGYTQETVSERIGRSRSAVANTLRLLSLPEGALELVKTGELSAGHARALIPLKYEELVLRYADIVIKQDLSVRATEELVRKYGKVRPESERVSYRDPAMREAEDVLSAKLETKVRITGGEKKGKIVIEYYTGEQLQSLYEYLTR